MTKLMRPLIALSLPILISNAFAAEVKVKIINKSSFDIHEMYLSPTKQNEWGQDQLGEEVVSKDESFELRGIPVGKYDFRIVDEDGDACVINDVKVVENEAVEFDDSLLVGCQAATDDEVEKAEEEKKDDGGKDDKE